MDTINGITVSGGDAGNSRYYANSVGLDSNGDATITGNTDGSDTQDWYEFTANGSGTATLDLTGLSSDTDLYLYNSEGERLSSSAAGGTTSEHISYNLTSGDTYYVQVAQYSGDSDYNLSIDTTSSEVTSNSQDMTVDLVGYLNMDAADLAIAQ